MRSWLLPLVSAAAGALLAWLFMRGRSARDQALAATTRSALEERLRAREEQLSELRREAGEQEIARAALQERSDALGARVARLEAALEHERSLAAEKARVLEDAEQRFRETFQALSASALRSNNESFLALARTQLEQLHLRSGAELEERRKAFDQLVKPIAESLARVDSRIEEVEKTRLEAHGSLTQHLRAMQAMQAELRGETHNLVKALRAPAVRGRWGEIQLKRVVEIAGMVEYCDFVQQESVESDDGRRRPDLVVRLPSGRCVAVDSKAPLQHYLDALEARDEASRVAALARHAEQVRKHIAELSGKAYWDAIGSSPEFVVLFLPGETFFSAALEHDPSLIEAGVEKQVILATPTTLIALLKAVAYGWRQERLAKNAQEISEAGRRLYDRVGTFLEHLRRVGSSLERAVAMYNGAVGSLESRVLPSARDLRRLGAASGSDLPPVAGVERAPRSVSIPELSFTTGDAEV